MNRTDIPKLIQKAITPGHSVWADLGSGDGAFTMALRELAGPDVEIYSIDLNNSRLVQQDKIFSQHFPGSRIHYMQADFSVPFVLPSLLDGVILANSLHFSNDQANVLARIKTLLKPNGKIIIIEYNITQATSWIPYPVPFERLRTLLPTAGYPAPQLLATVPSNFNREIYSAYSQV